MAKQKRKTTTVKKKKWITILSPENRELGESYIEDPKTIEGRKIKVNLMNYMNDSKKRKYNVQFLITSFDGDKAKTRMCAFETQPTAIKMGVRKGSDRVDHRIIIKSVDKESLIIKPIIATKGNVSASVRTSIRKEFDKLLIEKTSKLTTAQIFSDIISQKIQREIKKSLAKVHPIRNIGIKKALIKTMNKELNLEIEKSEEVSKKEE